MSFARDNPRRPPSTVTHTARPESSPSPAETAVRNHLLVGRRLARTPPCATSWHVRLSGQLCKGHTLTGHRLVQAPAAGTAASPQRRGRLLQRARQEMLGCLLLAVCAYTQPTKPALQILAGLELQGHCRDTILLDGCVTPPYSSAVLTIFAWTT